MTAFTSTELVVPTVGEDSVGVGSWKWARESSLGRTEEKTLALENGDWKVIDL
uniref:Uncharacterized protein n=1 Tax=Hyaloperonospora arabidopsidis (strain Emoy2) TaxID=559515 RepID=M4B3Z8_HYAAE